MTKKALQKDLNFEQVCKNPKSTISDRAIARIATHPQFNKKIENIKAAVKAFKEERTKGGKQGGKEQVPNNIAVKLNTQSPGKREERKTEKEQKDIAHYNEDGEGVLEDNKDATVANPKKDTVVVVHSAATADVQKKKIPESKHVTPPSTTTSEVKNTVSNEPCSKDMTKIPNPTMPHKKEDEEESDLEESDEEEKEYFDDSTEERFNKQSSQSEDSEDDFFVGKVSKFKKKKPKSADGEEKVAGGAEVKGGSADEPKPSDKLQSQLDELESRLKSKAKPFQSVFCSSLSGSKQSRGRGGDKLRGQGKPKGASGLNRSFSKQSNFQHEATGAERNTGSKYSKPCPEGRGRGRGRGRGDVKRQNVGGGVFTHQAPQQALHPSWEASKKRKEQQGQILAFQGKKIKFDDDSD